MVEITLVFIATCTVALMGYFAVYRKCPFFIFGADFSSGT